MDHFLFFSCTIRRDTTISPRILHADFCKQTVKKLPTAKNGEEFFYMVYSKLVFTKQYFSVKYPPAYPFQIQGSL